MTEEAGRPSAIQFKIGDESETWRLAEDVAAILQAGDLVTLSGDLGAGKTSFARALIRSACGDSTLEVPSPTFAVRIDYQAAHLQLAHVDLYRIAGEEDAEELGLDEALETGALIVEWPDRIAWPAIPNRLDIAIETSGEDRRIGFHMAGTFASRIGRSRAIRDLLDRNGFTGAQRLHVVGDASAKAFERVVNAAGDSAIVMNAPARSPGPPVWEGRSYDAVAHRALDIMPFLAIDAALGAAGIHVPRILAHDSALGLVLSEDLGAESVTEKAGEPIAERYKAAIDLLAFMHERQWPDRLDVDGHSYRVPPYDRDALLIELSLYADWYVPHARGQAFSAGERQSFLDDWSGVLAHLDDTATTWVMRDFHSPNILWQPEAEGLARVGVIDIQDTLVGHPAYDVASLAQDARVDMSEELERALVTRYCAARQAGGGQFDEAGFAQAYAILGAQRATKVLGAFTRLAFHDGRPGYAKHLPRVEQVLARNLKHPVLSALHVWYGQLA